MRCGGKNAQGKPCQAFALGGSKPARCAAHSKGKGAKHMAEIGRQGGKQRMRQVDRTEVLPATPAPPPPLETKEDVANAMRKLYAELHAGIMDARTGFAALQALQYLLATGTLPEGQPPEAQFFAQFEHIEVTADGDGATYGVTAEGTRVLLTDRQVAAWNRLLRTQLVGGTGDVTLTVKRRRGDGTQYQVRPAEPSEVEVVCEIERRPEEPSPRELPVARA